DQGIRAGRPGAPEPARPHPEPPGGQARERRTPARDAHRGADGVAAGRPGPAAVGAAEPAQLPGQAASRRGEGPGTRGRRAARDDGQAEVRRPVEPRRQEDGAAAAQLAAGLSPRSRPGCDRSTDRPRRRWPEYLVTVWYVTG